MPGAPVKDGARVCIEGLRAKPELNGRTGTVRGACDTTSGRWIIELDGTEVSCHISVRPSNLKVSSDNDAGLQQCWTCHLCSFDNLDMQSQTCGVCNGRNPNLQSWTCNACTFQNSDMDLDACDVCNSPKQPIAPPPAHSPVKTTANKNYCSIADVLPQGHPLGLLVENAMADFHANYAATMQQRQQDILASMVAKKAPPKAFDVFGDLRRWNEAKITARRDVSRQLPPKLAPVALPLFATLEQLHAARVFLRLCNARGDRERVAQLELRMAQLERENMQLRSLQ